MNPKVPAEEEVLGYFKKLSNWGRWGKDDQLGTLNLVTPEKRVKAARLVKEGLSVTCARPIGQEQAVDVMSQPLHFMASSGEKWAGVKSKPNQTQGSSDFIGLSFHGYTVTHIDSLCHIFWDGQMYNGRPAELITTREGATVESIDIIRDGVVSRGVLLDIPRTRGVKWLEPKEGVYPQDLEAAEKAENVRVEPGDVLFVRIGNLKRRREVGPTHPMVDGCAGIHAACLPWLHQRGVAMLGSCAPTDVEPSGYPNFSLPVHKVGIVAMGLWLMDNVNLEDLAATCEKFNRWEFLLTVGPLRLINTTGAPGNPIAIF